jgi:putative transposase
LPVIPDSEIKTITGCDMGLEKLVYLSDGSSVDNPRFATNKKTKRLMGIRQRRVSRKQKGSKNRSKAQLRVSKLHNRIQQRRESYQWDVANRIVKKADAVLFNVGMYERSSDNTLPQKGKRRVGENPEYKQLSLWDI